MKTLKLNVEELEQRIAPDAPGAPGAGTAGPPDNQVRPPFVILEPVAPEDSSP